ncbi:hypothetical protein RJ640_003141 [Escallonia rubra]|uniref:Reverse transcriptase domain-containing protein n=1 Tax=Escallonia rubra TaxID=112253 RepID=A0AA88RHL4_9ASTE|nr:hypothetical protein RJ640_003141 [Escallonia rubra]
MASGDRSERKQRHWDCIESSKPNGRAGPGGKSHRSRSRLRPMKVGCVNVQGLPDHKWAAVTALLDDGVFDYLFLLETWYIRHEARRRDPRVIAATPAPLHYAKSGHPPGGIIVLGTSRARAWLRGEAIVHGQEAIVISTTQGRFAGVYLPPRMSPTEVETSLDAIVGCDAILGDINTRFNGLPLQHGTPGPPPRLEVFRRWMRKGAITHTMPVQDPSPIARGRCDGMLNVDHCFTRPNLRSAILTLPQTSALGFQSDHHYALHLRLNPTIEETDGAFRLRRYRIRGLEEEIKVEAVRRLWERCSGHRPHLFERTSHIDRRNDDLVEVCQRISKAILGEASNRRQSYRSRTSSAPPMPSAVPLHTDDKDDYGIRGSIRLYKRAVRISQENGPLLPTETGRNRGITAIEEVAEGFAHRFTSESPLPDPEVFDHDNEANDGGNAIEEFSIEEVTRELRHQDASKSCGGDGVHIRLMKSLATTSFVQALAVLYNSCIRRGKTPRSWNETVVCLIIKDPHRRKDADNVRPISLIVMFRKVFERLLLRRFDANGWARVQPAQAGFRSHYSTCINAAILHALLASRRVTHVAFLDFRAAFDVVDHGILAGILRRRGCPEQMLALIANLTFFDVFSRVVSDSRISRRFARTRGVLQGSPLSPYLFNIFVDGLLEELNAEKGPIPRSLFFADDGVLLGASSREIQQLLNIVEKWTVSHKIGLNVKKCGYLAPQGCEDVVSVGGVEVGKVDEYVYLGFPFTIRGIDFTKHLTKRLSQACGRATFLSLHSDDWGIAHRNRVYRQYLAPMFEYGAPLLAAWAENDPGLWRETQEASKTLFGWISGYTSFPHLTRNLLGWLDLPRRFAALKTLFQVVIRGAPLDSPLRRLAGLTWEPKSFFTCLTTDPAFKEYLQSTHDLPQAMTQKKIRKSVYSFLQKRKENSLHQEASKKPLTRMIPASSRLKRDMRGADCILKAPRHYQKPFLQYRRGTFHINQICVCGERFRRGHEECFRLRGVSWLSKTEIRIIVRIRRTLGTKSTFTDIDFLLNSGKFRRAYRILMHISRSLMRTNSSDIDQNPP